MAQRMQCVTGPPPTHQFATAMHRRTTNTLPIDEPLLADTSRRFVRLIEERSDGLIAFEFSIGWPELAVERPQQGAAARRLITFHTSPPNDIGDKPR